MDIKHLMLNVIIDMWDSQANTNKTTQLAIVGSQLQYMNLHPENVGYMVRVGHRKLSENATVFYEDNKNWINGLAIAFAV